MKRVGEREKNKTKPRNKANFKLHQNGTYIDQSKVVFIDWKLLWANVFFQSRGIGALLKKKKEKKSQKPNQTEKKYKGINYLEY